MRIVVQRVTSAQVKVSQDICGKIGKGLLVFFGVHKEDKPEDTVWLVNKMLNLRIFQDDAGKMNLSLKEIGAEVLIVSQFTLYGNCANGRRPDFFETAQPETAEKIYDKFVQEVKKELVQVQTGIFGAYMEVSLVNDGPVTFIIDTKSKNYKD